MSVSQCFALAGEIEAFFERAINRASSSDPVCRSALDSFSKGLSFHTRHYYARDISYFIFSRKTKMYPSLTTTCASYA